MSMVRITPEFQNNIRTAMENPFRFERTERFAMQKVLAGAERVGEVEQVFLDTALDALCRQHGRRHNNLTEKAA